MHKLIPVLLLGCITWLILPSCSKRQRILNEQKEVLVELAAKQDASIKLLMSEDLVDSLRYLNDSGYRVAITKQAQHWILSSDSILKEAEHLQRRYDSLDTELFMLDL